MPDSLIAPALSVLNVGVDTFTRSVTDAGHHATQVDWQPPGNADPRVAWLLAQLAGDVEKNFGAFARRQVAPQRLRKIAAWVSAGLSRLLARLPESWTRGLYLPDCEPGEAKTKLPETDPFDRLRP